MTRRVFNVDYDFDLAVSQGLIDNVEHFAVFGYNPNLQQNISAAIWPQGGAYVWPSSAGQNMEIVSSNPADNQMVLVNALDVDWNRPSTPLVIQLTGTTPVQLPYPMVRVNQIINVDSTPTLGDVRVRASGGGTVFCIMPVNDQISQQIVFSTPANYFAKLETSLVTLNKSGGPDTSVVFSYMRRNFGGVFGRGARFGLIRNGVSAVTIHVNKVAPLPPKSDIVMNAVSDSSGADVSARLPYTLYKVV